MECLRATKSRDLVNAENLVRADKINEGKRTDNLEGLSIGDVLNVGGVGKAEQIYQYMDGEIYRIHTWKALVPEKLTTQKYEATREMLRQGILEKVEDPIDYNFPRNRPEKLTHEDISSYLANQESIRN